MMKSFKFAAIAIPLLLATRPAMAYTPMMCETEQNVVVTEVSINPPGDNNESSGLIWIGITRADGSKERYVANSAGYRLNEAWGPSLLSVALTAWSSGAVVRLVLDKTTAGNSCSAIRTTSFGGVSYRNGLSSLVLMA